MILLMENEGLENTQTIAPSYGHTVLPDWFDEIAAMKELVQTFAKQRSVQAWLLKKFNTDAIDDVEHAFNVFVNDSYLNWKKSA